MIDIRLPNITATSSDGKIQQMQSYMHQLVEQLNWALNTVETAQSDSSTPSVKYQKSAPATQEEAEETFNSIKALIIKSADIVKAYEETIRTHFHGEYFAESDFGSFVDNTNRYVEENSRGVTEAYDRLQGIDTNLDGLLDYVETTQGYIKRGELADGSIGVEIGETKPDGSYRHFARFTAKKLSFYDVNDAEVAYIGAGDGDTSNSNCLYVRGKAVFLGEIQLGGYKTDTTDGLAFTWIGG